MRESLLRVAAQQRPHFVVHGGDVAYGNALRACYPAWDTYLDAWERDLASPAGARFDAHFGGAGGNSKNMLDGMNPEGGYFDERGSFFFPGETPEQQRRRMATGSIHDPGSLNNPNASDRTSSQAWNKGKMPRDLTSVAFAEALRGDVDMGPIFIKYVDVGTQTFDVWMDSPIGQSLSQDAWNYRGTRDTSSQGHWNKL